MVGKIVACDRRLPAAFAAVVVNFLSISADLAVRPGGRSRGRAGHRAILPFVSASADRPGPAAGRRRPAAGAPIGLDAAGRVHGGCGAAAARRHADHGRAAIGRARAVGVKGSSTSAVLSRLLRGIRADADSGRRARRPVRRAAAGADRTGAVRARRGGGRAGPELRELIGARVVQGAGAGLVSPAALAGAVSGFPASAPRRGARASGAQAPGCRTCSARCSAGC